MHAPMKTSSRGGCYVFLGGFLKSSLIVIKQATIVFLLNFTRNFDQLQEKLPVEQSSDVLQCPAGHTFHCKILTFSNGCILLVIGSIYTKLGDFVKLGVLFYTWPVL